MINKFLMVLALVLASPAGAIAKPLIIACTLTPSSRDFGVPPEIVIARDGKGVTIYDPIIRHFMGKPLQAEVAVDTAERLTIRWTVKRIKKVEPSIPTIVYTAKLHLTQNTVSVNVVPQGDFYSYSGKGTCRRK